MQHLYYLQGFEDALGVMVKDQPEEEVGTVETDLLEGKLAVGKPIYIIIYFTASIS